MKRVLFLLPACLLFSGCIVYSPSPSTGSLGYTYDYTLPIGEGLPAAPTAHVSLAEPAVSHVLAERVPEPPRTPPIYSEIPEPAPRPRFAQTTRTVIVPPSSPVVREPAGAAPPLVQQQPAPSAQIPFSSTVVLGNTPFVVVTNTNMMTNMTNTAGIDTNRNQGLLGSTNQPGLTNLPTNAFGILPGTNINEAAGAATGFTNPPPAAPPLNEPAGAPAPRLPPQPRIPPITPGGTATPTAPQQQPQQQPIQPAPAAPPPQGPFTPVAPR